MKHREGPNQAFKGVTGREALIITQGRVGTRLRTAPTGLGILGALEYWGTEQGFCKQRVEEDLWRKRQASVMAKSRARSQCGTHRGQGREWC